MKFLRRSAFALLAALAAGAASAQDQMIKSARKEMAPDPGKALVIFVRSSMVVGAYSAPVIDVEVKNPEPKPGQAAIDDRVVGILSSYSKVAYQAEPGEHTFMSMPSGGGVALVLKASLQAGRTYYVLVKPNWGMSPSFSLMPMRNDAKADYRLDSPDLASWLGRTDFYEPTDFAQGWLNGNRQSINQKKADALAQWNKLPDDEKKKLTLLESDSK